MGKENDHQAPDVDPVIRGSFERLEDLRLQNPFPIVRIALSINGITPEPAEIDFVIDTGAQFTCLQPNDAGTWAGIPDDRLRDPRAWPSTSGGFGIGGSSAFFPMPAVYRFAHESGRHLALRQPIYIAQLTRENEEMPSLMGWDVLQHFRLSLDYASGDVRLTRRRGRQRRA
ncbi:MAG TPA: hypothetical protein VKV26_00750 [Dehalococcoidia bacterium]|nr:hypothetical protein [Dehalococcoidia bacterium]